MELTSFGLEPDEEEGNSAADSSWGKVDQESHALTVELNILGKVDLLETLP